MEKQIILSHVLDYLDLRGIKKRKSGKMIFIECIYCDNKNSNSMPNTYKFNCLKCDKTYSLLEIAQKYEEKFVEGEENQLQYLKELLDLNIVTKRDKEKLEEYLEFYEKNKFDLVPIIANGKIPIEQNWPKKHHREKEEWAEWIVNGLNVGVKTGKISEVTIIDIDQKPIPEEVKKLMGDTLIQESTNGYHLIYKYDAEIPKTRIDDLKIDLENDGGQVVIYPSKVKEVKRKLQLKEIISIPEEFKKFLLDKITVPRKTNSEEIIEDIETEDFRIDMFSQGNRNNSLVKLGGVFRKQLSGEQTRYVLNMLNRHNSNPVPQKEINAMMRKIDQYIKFDEQELSHKILEHLKETDEMSRTEIAMTIVGTNRGEDKKRIDKALCYLVREGYALKKGKYNYAIMKKAQWKEELINIGIPIDFKMPYFNDIMDFNEGDLILIGSRHSVGKTHISMNIIKQLVRQGINPYYLSLESGSRWAKIALKLGLKEGDFKWDELPDATMIELEKNAVTVIDWLCPNNYAETDKLLKYFVNQLQKNKGVAIVFVQLRENNEWLAKDLIKQFPSFACRYMYSNEDSGEYGKFVVDKMREPKINVKKYEIPCRYDWISKELKTIDSIEKEKKEN